MKRFLFVLLAAFIATLFIITSFAHGGRTDSQGGHFDRDTGDYHYHHGYPAHDHYDMDGDGDKDCPYGDYDNTKNNQGGVAKIEKDKTEHNKEAAATTKKEAPDKDASNTFDIGEFLGIILSSAFISFMITPFIVVLITSIFKKRLNSISEKTGKGIYVAVYILTTIVLASIIYNA